MNPYVAVEMSKGTSPCPVASALPVFTVDFVLYSAVTVICAPAEVVTRTSVVSLWCGDTSDTLAEQSNGRTAGAVGVALTTGGTTGGITAVGVALTTGGVGTGLTVARVGTGLAAEGVAAALVATATLADCVGFVDAVAFTTTGEAAAVTGLDEADGIRDAGAAGGITGLDAPPLTTLDLAAPSGVDVCVAAVVFELQPATTNPADRIVKASRRLIM